MAMQTRRHNQRAVKIAAQTYAASETQKSSPPVNETQEYLQVCDTLVVWVVVKRSLAGGNYRHGECGQVDIGKCTS